MEWFQLIANYVILLVALVFLMLMLLNIVCCIGMRYYEKHLIESVQNVPTPYLKLNRAASQDEFDFTWSDAEEFVLLVESQIKNLRIKLESLTETKDIESTRLTLLLLLYVYNDCIIYKGMEDEK